ncbi:hypothetical protein BY996DRAFT_6431605 [Phakopsora pachyrhizi]|nr:hypothetical protein BY996DRAFT_6431605 [Phakopsora pachyrhizi]
MEDPAQEIRDVVRSITEPYEASVIAKNIDKYFTEDAYILHPMLNQPRTKNGRQMLKGIYKVLRIFSINNKITFHAVMFNEDKTQGAIELTEDLYPRVPLFGSLRASIPLFVRIDLIKEEDGKFRIWRQHDSLPNDLGMVSLPFIPFFSALVTLINILKAANGVFLGTAGKFFLDRGYLGS